MFTAALYYFTTFLPTAACQLPPTVVISDKSTHGDLFGVITQETVVNKLASLKKTQTVKYIHEKSDLQKALDTEMLRRTVRCEAAKIIFRAIKRSIQCREEVEGNVNIPIPPPQPEVWVF